MALVLFALSFPAFKAATDGLGVGVVVFGRVAVGLPVLLLVARRRLSTTRTARRSLLAVGAVGMGGQTLAMTAGIDASSATVGALVLGLEPVGIAVAAALVLRERPPPATVLALAVGLGGVGVVSGVLSEPLGRLPLAGIGYLLATVILFSLYTVEVRRHAQSWPPIAVTTLTMAGAGLAALPVALLDVLRGTAVHAGARPSAYAGVLFLGLGVTAAAYALFAWLLARMTAAAMAIALYLLPPLGVLASYAVLGERVLARQLVGGALVLVAIGIARRGSRAG